MTRINREDLSALLDSAGIPAGIQGKLAANPHALWRLLEALGEIDFDVIETSRAYAFLLIADRSSSVRNWRDPLVDCYVGAVGELKTIKTTGTLFAGCIAITNEVEGGEVLLPFTPIGAANVGSDFEFEPAGMTPLYDTLVTSLVALRLLVEVAKRHRIQLTGMAYLLSDGEDVGSTMFDVHDASQMVRLMTGGRRKHRVSAVAVGASLQSTFLEMGIAQDAIRQIGTSEGDLHTLFAEMSQSVSATSQGGDAGGF